MAIGSEENVLYIRMFGGFALHWQGRLLTSNAKSRESQFNYLMQLLLHERNGVSRDRLEEILFGDREVEDARHALRSVIYNAKRRLRDFGLPDVNYIEHKKGVYFWTGKVPFEEDAAEFERLYKEAGREEQPDRRLDLYLEAAHRYTGEFLSQEAGTLWVAQEARRYREMFCDCVESAVEMLRSRKDYDRMEELGIYAAMVNPLADWETVTMEALVALGRYEDAQKLYNDTVELYFMEQGLRPSRQLMLLVRRLGVQMEHGHGALEEIQRKLSGERRAGEGGYLCPYPVFQGIYCVVKRMMERGGQSAYLMLCTVEGGRAQTAEREEISEVMGRSILDSVRCSDAVSRYGRDQYLVLLVNTTREDCQIVQKRIDGRFRTLCRGSEIRYCVNAVEEGELQTEAEGMPD